MATIKTETWVGWIGAIAVAAVAACFILLTFAYGEFETKDDANKAAAIGEKRDDIMLQYLIRIDDKIDRIPKRERR